MSSSAQPACSAANHLEEQKGRSSCVSCEPRPPPAVAVAGFEAWICSLTSCMIRTCEMGTGAKSANKEVTG